MTVFDFGCNLKSALVTSHFRKIIKLVRLWRNNSTNFKSTATKKFNFYTILLPVGSQHQRFFHAPAAGNEKAASLADFFVNPAE
jgi:hypothetical protein